MIFLDIETIPEPATLEEGYRWAVRKCPKRTKYPGEWAEKNMSEQWKRWALHPLHGRVLCVGIAKDEREPRVLWEDSELQTLELLDRGLAAYPDDSICAHNGQGFDFRFIRLRALKYGLKRLARRFYAEKPWEGCTEDTAILWAAPERPAYANTNGGGKLDDLAAFFGIPRPEQIGGAKVLQAYAEGRRLDIIQHAADDVKVLRHVWGFLQC